MSHMFTELRKKVEDISKVQEWAEVALKQSFPASTWTILAFNLEGGRWDWAVVMDMTTPQLVFRVRHVPEANDHRRVDVRFVVDGAPISGWSELSYERDYGAEIVKLKGFEKAFFNHLGLDPRLADGKGSFAL